mmetsp:Transcript_6339/g.19016  ORF Transcript_6339/g.19016 Transcript_6339/m.19016 type:complete len:381 (-) Transcript_6339:1485-2627(-)
MRVQLTVALAVHNDLDDAVLLAAAQVIERARQLGARARLRVGHAHTRAEVTDGAVGWRMEELRQRIVADALRDGQEVKNAAATVVDHHHRHRRHTRALAQRREAVDIVHEADVAHHEGGGLARARRVADRRREHAVDAACAAIGGDARAGARVLALPDGRRLAEHIGVADGHRVSQKQRVALGQAREHIGRNAHLCEAATAAALVCCQPQPHRTRYRIRELHPHARVCRLQRAAQGGEGPGPGHSSHQCRDAGLDAELGAVRLVQPRSVGRHQKPRAHGAGTGASVEELGHPLRQRPLTQLNDHIRVKRRPQALLSEKLVVVRHERTARATRGAHAQRRRHVRQHRPARALSKCHHRPRIRGAQRAAGHHQPARGALEKR